MNKLINIERQILNFIKNIVRNQSIELIVCCERKATAVLRAIISEIPKDKFLWEWPKVLSTAAVDQYDWQSFKGNKVLLFDELIHHGNSLETQEKNLREFLPDNIELITAGFAVWEHCQHKPQFCYYAAVDLETYDDIRTSIIFMLQKHGSLLLDTEHIELSVRIHCGIREFYNELARASENHRTYSFISGAGRTNLTIDQPDILCKDILKQVLTPGSNTIGTVSKIRVLERNHENFSVLPIFYPNTKCVPSNEWIENLPEFVRNDRLIKSKGSSEIFYIVALLGSIELIRSVVAALSDFIRRGKITFEIPIERFPHLHTMFPRVDINGLHNYISNVVAKSKKIKPKRSRRSVCAKSIPNLQLVKLSSHVICRLVEEYEQISFDPPKGKSWKELMYIAEAENQDIKLDSGALTVVVDRLIDSGLIVTDVEKVTSSSGEPYYIRTFIPEGEVVSAKIRQQIMVRDPECLLAI